MTTAVTTETPVNAIVLYSSQSLPVANLVAAFAVVDSHITPIHLPVTKSGTVLRLPALQRGRKPLNIGRRIWRNVMCRYNYALKYVPLSQRLVATPIGELLGCTLHTYIGYLESKMLPGMNWMNYGKRGWHIDHIIGIDNWDLSNRRHVRSCFHYTNTQPLWALLNYKKTKRTPNVDINLYLLPEE